MQRGLVHGQSSVVVQTTSSPLAVSSCLHRLPRSGSDRSTWSTCSGTITRTLKLLLAISSCKFSTFWPRLRPGPGACDTGVPGAGLRKLPRMTGLKFPKCAVSSLAHSQVLSSASASVFPGCCRRMYTVKACRTGFAASDSISGPIIYTRPRMRHCVFAWAAQMTPSMGPPAHDLGYSGTLVGAAEEPENISDTLSMRTSVVMVSRSVW